MAREPEQRVWDSLALRTRPRILWQRHEDRYSAGIPDLSGVFKGRTFWCELKAATGGRALGLRQRQLNWMLERHEHGAPCILLVRRAPNEWAGCAVDKGNHARLTAGAGFDDIVYMGRAEIDPAHLIQGLIADSPPACYNQGEQET